MGDDLKKKLQNQAINLKINNLQIEFGLYLISKCFETSGKTLTTFNQQD